MSNINDDIGNNVLVMKPFGPSIAKVKIPENLVKELNTYIDKVIEDEKKANDLNLGPGLAGDVTQEFKLEQEFMSNVVKNFR